MDSYLLLNFGHFTLRTKEDGQLHDRGHNLYSRFHISGRDIAAFFTDCGSKSQPFRWGSQTPTSARSEDTDRFYSLIDRSGMSVIVDQIKVPHPNYPSTRISVQIPSLGVHFSPDRYFRLNHLLNLFNGSMPNNEQHKVEHLQTGFVPWDPPDLAAEARILVWKVWELVTQLLLGNPVFLYYLDYTFMYWNLKVPKAINGVQCLPFSIPCNFC